MKLFIWNKAQKAAFLMVLGCQIQGLAGTEFQYFEGEIDYWHNTDTKPTAIAPPKEGIQSAKKAGEPTQEGEPFSWQKFLNPKNREFFKEGDYTPPEPFMEIVRNPTDANLKMWFSYIDKKNDLTKRLQERMNEYMSKNSAQFESSARASMTAKLASLPVTEPAAKRFRFRMYFDSHCPHCKKMFGTLADLQARGFLEAKQIDSGPRGAEGVNIPTSRATSNELKEKDIQSVPVLLIGDMETKTVYRLTGYQSTASVFAAIAQTRGQ